MDIIRQERFGQDGLRSKARAGCGASLLYVEPRSVAAGCSVKSWGGHKDILFHLPVWTPSDQKRVPSAIIKVLTVLL